MSLPSGNTVLGGDNPTNETPAHLIEPTAQLVHDDGMEHLTNLTVDAVLDPAVLAPAIAFSATLLSGLGARLVEFCQDQRPSRSMANGLLDETP